MGARAAFVVGSLGGLLIACGGGGAVGGSTYGEPVAEKSATEPAASSDSPANSGRTPAPAEEQEAEGPPAAMKLAPACGNPGLRVVLTLGLTNDHRVPSCFDAQQANVTFAPNKPGKITAMGPMADGFCALDVEIPKGAESGKVQVQIGKDVFESDVVFGVPCP